ncbi:AAA family ATPase [Lacrimispora sp. 210928-DFI.3.58]|uniref:AAA family ATPase n=1 Tax=Lacrimispora sp. 210928-DFI.3.58 TaxID=2883214 RepID=UPI001D070C07|nr:AAA family ATPase [Lacrimispora sp. 210928-DFI.3.58]MCB7321035.1 AAA family ATPase [Lacrimispora sp. 210928-DFI.3.58]
MKVLYMIGGPMGVGKTAVCQQLKKQLPDSVFLDGDWCWDADPFQVTEETKRMVLDNICHILNNFLHCSAYQTVIFGWVMHEQSIINAILDKLDIQNCEVFCISLMVNEKNLEKRLEQDIAKGIRTEDVIGRSVMRIPLYENLETIKIDTNDKTVSEIAEEVRSISKAERNRLDNLKNMEA